MNYLLNYNMENYLLRIATIQMCLMSLYESRESNGSISLLNLFNKKLALFGLVLSIKATCKHLMCCFYFDT